MSKAAQSRSGHLRLARMSVMWMLLACTHRLGAQAEHNTTDVSAAVVQWLQARSERGVVINTVKLRDDRTLPAEWSPPDRAQIAAATGARFASREETLRCSGTHTCRLPEQVVFVTLGIPRTGTQGVTIRLLVQANWASRPGFLLNTLTELTLQRITGEWKVVAERRLIES